MVIMMVVGDTQSVHNNGNHIGHTFNKTMTIEHSDQDEVTPGTHTAEYERDQRISKKKRFYKREKLKKKGAEDNGSNGSLTSSSTSSEKTSSKMSRHDHLSSSNGVYITNDSDKRSKCSQSGGSNSGDQNHNLTQDSKYNGRSSYYHKKDINLNNSLTGTPRYSTSITAALDNLKDDITYEKQKSNNGVIEGHHKLRLKTVSELVTLGTAFSGNNNSPQVFMEGKSGGFVPTTRAVALRSNDRTVWLEQVPELDLQTSLDLAIIIQKIFAPISNISFGLLGGVALMQSFMSYTYLHNKENIEDMLDFVESYNIFARVAPTAFYILLAICVVAIFDRFDLAHLDIRHCSDTLLYRNGWCLVVIYVITLLLTLCTAELDDMLLLYPFDRSNFANQTSVYYRLSSWHTLNISRCIFAMLGWFIISITQPEDLLLHHLKSIKQFDEQQPKEILVVRSPSTANNMDY